MGASTAEHRRNIVALQCSAKKVGEIGVLSLSGRLLLGEDCAVLHEAIRQQLSDGTSKLVINLAACTYVDSAGLGELVSGLAAARKTGGDMKLSNLSKRVGDLLRVTHLYKVFDVRDEEKAALAAFVQ
jgi:anti-sigma B factor antagonist